MDNITLAGTEEETRLSHATLLELPFFECSIQISATMQDLTVLFKQTPNLPGAIVLDGRDCVGMISRDQCFETLGRPFGVELYLKKPLSVFIKRNDSSPLILKENTRIYDAVNNALMRNSTQLYDPVIVVSERKRHYRLVDMRTLLKAQNDILSKLVIEVEKLSVIDPLTGLLNRRGFFNKAQKNLEIARINNWEVAVVMADIDLFKTVNDIYGHQIGDQVILSIAQEFGLMVRETDITGRYGGEEFIGMFTDVSEAEAFAIAERLRQRIEGLVIQTEFYNINVTISAGICHCSAGSAGIESLFSRADKALYEAKAAGRNRVVIWKNTYPHSHLECNPKLMNNTILDSNQDIRLYDEMVASWARALEMRDKETEGHARRVTTLSVRIARRLGMDNEECENIRRGALLHDIGKIAIPDSILFKMGKLDDEEWEIMKRHPIYAYNFIEPIPILGKLMDIPYCHHEHWNGSGYPRGLREMEIPLPARIFTLVDVWDALTSDRCYRPAWSKEEAIQYIHEQSGVLFDPELTPIFLEILQQNGFMAE
ncbi:MAG: diguanylate cyclase [Leptolinea sp.]|jgi:diguanylate cyclase (GGDEF)-like protein|nr:diguanylate cyclase [Leptolinea sp.]